MKKHIEALEARRDYLARKLSGDLPVQHKEFLSVFREEKDALDWALSLLNAPETQLVLEMDPDTGEVLSGVVEPLKARTFAPIGNTGHYGPIREGATVQSLVNVKHADIMKGEVGKLTKFDTWVTEEYPYIARFDGGRTAAFAREDLRRVD